MYYTKTPPYTISEQKLNSLDNYDTYATLSAIKESDRVIDRLYYITSENKYYRYDTESNEFAIAINMSSIEELQAEQLQLQAALARSNTALQNRISEVEPRLLAAEQKLVSQEVKLTEQSNIELSRMDNGTLIGVSQRPVFSEAFVIDAVTSPTNVTSKQYVDNSVSVLRHEIESSRVTLDTPFNSNIIVESTNNNYTVLTKAIQKHSRVRVENPIPLTGDELASKSYVDDAIVLYSAGKNINIASNSVATVDSPSFQAVILEIPPTQDNHAVTKQYADQFVRKSVYQKPQHFQLFMYASPEDPDGVHVGNCHYSINLDGSITVGGYFRYTTTSSLFQNATTTAVFRLPFKRLTYNHDTQIVYNTDTLQQPDISRDIYGGLWYHKSFDAIYYSSRAWWANADQAFMFMYPYDWAAGNAIPVQSKEFFNRTMNVNFKFTYHGVIYPLIPCTHVRMY